METNFNTPQRQSAIGVLVLFFDSLQKFGRALFPVLFIFFFKFKEQNPIYIILGLLVLFIIIGLIAYLRYVNFTFYIDDVNDEFVVNEGIVNKTKTTIQLNKIQQVNIHQNLLLRIINSYSLSVDTAGSEKKEGNIKAISHNLALALKAKLLENESIVNDIKPIEEVSEDNNVFTSQSHPFLKINVISLLKVGITSNYVKSIGLILTFFFTIIENLRNIGKEDLIDEDKIQHTFENYPALYAVTLFIMIMFAIIFVINIGRTLLKFFNYTITKQKGSLLLSYGLINTESTILKPEKVQVIKISRNYFQKKLNVLEIKIKQASTDSEKNKKAQIEIPGCNTSEKDAILKLLFKTLPENGVPMKPNFRRLVFSIFLTIILPLSGFLIFANYVDATILNYSNFALVYCVFFIIILFFGFRNYKLFVNQDFIIKQSGAWDVDQEIIEIQKIQAITTSQLFWHKSLDIGTLTMHTAGGNLSFQLGNYTKIKEYVNHWLYEIETSNSNWM